MLHGDGESTKINYPKINLVVHNNIVHGGGDAQHFNTFGNQPIRYLFCKNICNSPPLKIKIYKKPTYLSSNLQDKPKLN